MLGKYIAIFTLPILVLGDMNWYKSKDIAGAAKKNIFSKMKEAGLSDLDAKDLKKFTQKISSLDKSSIDGIVSSISNADFGNINMSSFNISDLSAEQLKSIGINNSLLNNINSLGLENVSLSNLEKFGSNLGSLPVQEIGEFGKKISGLDLSKVEGNFNLDKLSSLNIDSIDQLDFSNISFEDVAETTKDLLKNFDTGQFGKFAENFDAKSLQGISENLSDLDLQNMDLESLGVKDLKISELSLENLKSIGIDNDMMNKLDSLGLSDLNLDDLGDFSGKISSFSSEDFASLGESLDNFDFSSLSNLTSLGSGEGVDSIMGVGQDFLSNGFDMSSLSLDFSSAINLLSLAGISDAKTTWGGTSQIINGQNMLYSQEQAIFSGIIQINKLNNLANLRVIFVQHQCNQLVTNENEILADYQIY